MKITKYNAICNLGNNIDEIFERALLGDNSKFKMLDGKRLGVVDCDLPLIDNPDYNLRCNRLVLECIKDFGIENFDKDSLAVVCATTNSGVEEYDETLCEKHYEIGNPAEFLYKHFSLNNFYTSVSTACSSGIKAFSIAKNLLDKKVAKQVLVVGVDSLAKVPIYGFDSLEILSKEPTIPFSKNRKGINIGEGVAAFMVELGSVKDNEIEIAGIGETTDSYHATTPDPDGIEAERAIRLALGNVKTVDYINLHGTGTLANDLMEGRAIYNVFGSNVPVSSTKPLTGHCLGAAASLEIALCCKLLENGKGQVFPHIYDSKYDMDIPQIYLADKNTTLKSIKSCLCTSFGFGGTNTAILLKHV